MQAHVDLGKGLAQARNRLWQDIAGLGVCGGNGERAAVLGGVLLADASQITDLAHDEFDALEHMLAGLGHALEPLAVAREDFHAQFLFQLNDGLGDARLGSVQGLGRFGQVEIAAHRLLDKAKLVKVHNLIRLIIEFIMPSQ